MRYSPALLQSLKGSFRHLKTPLIDAPAAQRDPAVIETVSAMLSDIQHRGLDAVLDYARKLDNYQGGDIELSAEQIATSGDRLPADLREAIELGSARTKAFAAEQRAHLTDFETELVPGLITGARYIPVVARRRVPPRRTLPADRQRVHDRRRRQGRGRSHRHRVHAAPAARRRQRRRRLRRPPLRRRPGLRPRRRAGARCDGVRPARRTADRHARRRRQRVVAEAKRQLFGAVAIDLLAGPSEVAVISDETADPEIVAADLLGQAEHGPNSPAALVTTSAEHGRAVIEAVERQLGELATEPIAGPAWRDYGSVTVAKDRETAVALMDDLAPEHLEVLTADDAWYHDNLRNYGSIFIGPWSTVAYSDKGMAGTNHVLPTAGGAKHSAGLSVSRFLKPLTYQRIAREATPALANAVQVISDSEGMAAHSATATMRLATYQDDQPAA